MTINIFGEAEGLRAIDLTAENPTRAITAAGPAVLKIMTSIKANVDIYYLGLRENSQRIRTHEGNTVFYRDARLPGRKVLS